MTATGMVATLYAYARLQLRYAQMLKMRAYMRRVIREEMSRWAQSQQGIPYDWGCIDSGDDE